MSKGSIKESCHSSGYSAIFKIPLAAYVAKIMLQYERIVALDLKESNLTINCNFEINRSNNL